MSNSSLLSKLPESNLPDNKQLSAIALLVYSPYKKNEIAKKVGVSERTLYNWFREEKFRYALNREHNKFCRTLSQEFAKPYFDLLHAAYNAQIDMLMNGSFEDRDSVLNRLSQHINFGQPQNITATAQNLEDEEKRAEEQILERWNERYNTTLRKAEEVLKEFEKKDQSTKDTDT